MKNSKSKLLFEINERPMVMASFDALFEVCEKMVIVIGYQGSLVKDTILQNANEKFGADAVAAKCQFYTQEIQGGTGHAVQTALDNLGKRITSYPETLVLNGDLPLMTLETLRDFLKRAREEKAQSACLTIPLKVPTGMGRIVRDSLGGFESIKEEKDASADERRIQEVNGGVYYFQSSFLDAEIRKLKDNNSQKELYLTDLLGRSESSMRRSAALMARRPRDLLGVNTTHELARVRRLAQQRLQKSVAEELGVEFFDTTTTFISARARFDGHAVLGPSVRISGNTRIGVGAVFEGCNFVKDSKIDAEAEIRWGTVLEEASVGEGASVGPMARLRPGTVLGKKVKIGNFVETKKARFGDGSKASHLSYIGDAEIGVEANLGAGTITCNYDGFQKHMTKVGDRAFVGSDTQLIAPVVVGDDAYVASGTAVTQDVPAGALAISRPDMVVKEGYARKIAEKRKNKG